MSIEMYRNTVGFSDHIINLVRRSVEFENLKSPEILVQKLQQILTQKREVDLADIRDVSFCDCTVALKDGRDLPGVTATFVFSGGREEQVTYPRHIDFLWEAERRHLDISLNLDDFPEEDTGRERIFQRFEEGFLRFISDMRRVIKEI